MTRFLHTSDWQLGLNRRFISPDARERYAQARLDAVRRLGDVARERECRFVVVAGDVFESNQVARATVARALEALRAVPVPVYLLPGNHDPLNDASVYRHPHFVDHLPAHVHVVTDAAPVAAWDGVELVGAPWTGKRPEANPLHDALAALAPARDRVRVCLAHGEVDALAAFSDSPAALSYGLMQAALADGRAHYIALGDKHSLTRVDPDGRIWYSGSPEATAFREPDPGWVNVVDVDPSGVRTEAVRVGAWRFVELDERDITSAEAVQDLLTRLDGMPDKDRCVLRLALSGLLGLEDMDALGRGLEHLRELFAAFDLDGGALHCRVDGDDAALDRFAGFAAETVRRLRDRAAKDGGEAEAARDALLLLLHLTREDGHAL